MKRTILMCAAMLTALQLMAGEPISLKDITSGVFWAKRISGVNPLKGTSEYAQVSADGRQVVKYSFRTGKPTGVIFDLSDVGCCCRRIPTASIAVRSRQTSISMK